MGLSGHLASCHVFRTQIPMITSGKATVASAFYREREKERKGCFILPGLMPA